MFLIFLQNNYNSFKIIILKMLPNSIDSSPSNIGLIFPPLDTLLLYFKGKGSFKKYNKNTYFIFSSANSN